MAVGTQTHPSLIQGISQQSSIARSTASCEDQENCLNDVLDGVVSRMGSVIRGVIAENYVDPFVHKVDRSESERYRIVIEDADIRIINLTSGALSTITGDISAYLAQTGSARKAFQAVTVGDTTFLLNRQKVVQMETDKSPDRTNQAVAYFKACGYKVTYTLNIKVGTTTYTASWTTPDNSESGNAAYIATDYVAEQFRLALNSTVFPAMVSDGVTGFAAARYGSTIVLDAPSGTDFDIWTTDGVGDTQLLSFKDNVKSIDKLPAKCVEGYIVSISPDGGASKDKYYLRYEGGLNTGRWTEVVAPGTVTDLDADTMPHLLVLTGPDTFEVKKATWGKRLAGDGIDTSPDPSFVGQTIQSLQFLGGRLTITTEYTSVLSRARNAYVYFPDTAQTNLDTAPIDYDVSNGSSTLIGRSVVAGGKLQFWGDGQQTYLDTGQESIKEDTTEVLPLTNYEYDGEIAPQAIGLSSLMFGTGVDRWSKVTEVFFARAGVPQGEIEVSAHVPKLLEGKLTVLAPGQASGTAMVLTAGSPNLAYYYQSYNQGQDRVQSAWNKWRFPACEKVLWAEIIGRTAYFLLQWSNVCTLEAVKLDSTGDETAERFPLRLDHRVSEADAEWEDGGFTLSLPYAVPEARRGTFTCVERKDVEDTSQRGRDVAFEWVNDTTVRVLASSSDILFFFGSIPTARRADSRFYVRDKSSEQPILHDRLLLLSLQVSHKDTVQYDIVVTQKDGTSVVETFVGRVLGDSTILNQDVPVVTGDHRASINMLAEDVSIELVNQTVFPAIWAAMKYAYDLTLRM